MVIVRNQIISLCLQCTDEYVRDGQMCRIKLSNSSEFNSTNNCPGQNCEQVRIIHT